MDTQKISQINHVNNPANNKPRHTNVVAAYLVLKKNDAILLLKRKNTGYEDSNYSVIAGHVESGESFRQTIIREAKEEANVSISETDIIRTHVQHRKSSWDQSERVDVYFMVEKWSGQIKNMEPEKSEALEWHAINKLPTNTIDCVKVALKSLFEGIEYSEIGWHKS